MKERMIENNRVTISGKIISNFEFSHEIFGVGFYVANLLSKRTSGINDIIPIMVSEKLVDIKYDWKGQYVEVIGQFKSYNKRGDEGSKLILFVFARKISVIGEIPFDDDKNHIFLGGLICKKPIYRNTPLGREISDIFLAVNRPYGKSDYLPVICWGRNARFAGNLEVGTHINIEGRIQSREYRKKISDDEFETRVAYEVSASRINIVEETEDREHEEEN